MIPHLIVTHDKSATTPSMLARAEAASLRHETVHRRSIGDATGARRGKHAPRRCAPGGGLMHCTVVHSSSERGLAPGVTRPLKVLEGRHCNAMQA